MPGWRSTTYIASPANRVWQALTDGRLTRHYFDFIEGFMSVQSNFRAGSSIESATDDETVQIEGQVLVAEPPTRLVTTFRVRYDSPARHELPSTVTGNLEPMGDVCRLTVHLEAGGTVTAEEFGICLPSILSNLKVQPRG